MMFAFKMKGGWDYHMKNTLFLYTLFMLCMGKTGYAMDGNSHDLLPIIGTMGKYIDSSGILYTDPPGIKTSAPVPVASSPFFPLLVVDYFIIELLGNKSWDQPEQDGPLLENKLFALTQEERNALTSLLPNKKREIETLIDDMSIFYAKDLFLKNKVLPEFIEYCVDSHKVKEKHLKKPSSLIQEEAPEELEMELTAQKIKREGLMMDFLFLRENIFKKMSPETITAYKNLGHTSTVSKWRAQRPPSFVEKYEDMKNKKDSMFFYLERYENIISKEDVMNACMKEKDMSLETLLQIYLDKMNQNFSKMKTEEDEGEEDRNPHRTAFTALGFNDSKINVWIFHREGEPYAIVMEKALYDAGPPTGITCKIQAALSKENTYDTPSSELVSSSDSFPLFVVDYLRKTLQEIDLTILFPPVKSIEELESLEPHERLKNTLLTLTAYEKKALFFLLPEKQQEIERLLDNIAVLHAQKICLKNSALPTFVAICLDFNTIKPEHLENHALLLEEKASTPLKLSLEAVKTMEKHRMRELAALKKDIENKLSTETLQAYSDLDYETTLSQWKKQRVPCFRVAWIRKIIDNGSVTTIMRP